VDISALDKIRTLQREGAPNLVHKVVKLFISNSAKLVENMKQALSTADAPQLQRAAHTLKSSSATVGALRLAGLCKDMEARARAGNLAQVEHALNRIEIEYARVRAALAEQAAATRAALTHTEPQP
jgi:HPt (histidine-containing phosphotransfer) domain-containing protein